MSKFFATADKVVFKSCGFNQAEAMADEDDCAWTEVVLFTWTEHDKIKHFGSLLEIEEPDEWFFCMCMGSHNFELYKKGNLITTISLHHGKHLRKEHWRSDAFLKRPEQLFKFLVDEGLDETLEHWMQ